MIGSMGNERNASLHGDAIGGRSKAVDSRYGMKVLIAARSVSWLALILIADAAGAATSVKPLLSATYDYSDNRNLAEGTEVPEVSGGGRAMLGVEFKTFSQLSEFLIRPQAEFAKYGGDTDEDTDDQFLYLTGRHKWQTAEFSFAGNYARETTLTDFDAVDFADPGTGPADELDSGVITKRGRRETIFASPSFTWDITPKTQAGFQYSFIDVAYSEVPDDRRTDFDNNEVALSLDYALSQRSTLGGILSAGIYTADADDVETDYQSAALTYQVRLSEISRVEFTAGVERTDSTSNDVAVGEETTDGFFGIRWDYLTELNKWQFYVGRSYDPSSTGTRSRRDQIRFNLSRHLSPRLVGIAGARFIQSQSGSEVVFNERDYARAQLGLRWEQTRTWSFGVTANYTYQDFADEPGDASAFGGLFDITYKGLGGPTR